MGSRRGREMEKHFLQGLKPIHAGRFTPGLKPRLLKRAIFSATYKSSRLQNRRVHSLPSRSGDLATVVASHTFRLTVRGGDGVAPSSRARSQRLMWRGQSPLRVKDVGGAVLVCDRQAPGLSDKVTAIYSKKALRAAAGGSYLHGSGA